METIISQKVAYLFKIVNWILVIPTTIFSIVTAFYSLMFVFAGVILCFAACRSNFDNLLFWNNASLRILQTLARRIKQNKGLLALGRDNFV